MPFIRYEETSADLGAPLVDGNTARKSYREGYFICAKEAALSLRSRKGDNRSAMPVLFLYRQYLELAIKDALHFSKAFDLDQSEERFRHDLPKLWEEGKKVLAIFVGPELLSPIDAIVNEFDAIDRGADAFRYPTNNKGEPQLPKDAHVLYQRLIDDMSDAQTILELTIDEIRIKEAKLDADIAEAVAKDRR
jgi:hypothetical protein